MVNIVKNNITIDIGKETLRYIYKKSTSTQTIITPFQQDNVLELELGYTETNYETFLVYNHATRRQNINYRCRFQDCNLVFNKICNIKSHMRKHSGVKPYVCDICFVMVS